VHTPTSSYLKHRWSEDQEQAGEGVQENQALPALGPAQSLDLHLASLVVISSGNTLQNAEWETSSPAPRHQNGAGTSWLCSMHGPYTKYPWRCLLSLENILCWGE